MSLPGRRKGAVKEECQKADIKKANWMGPYPVS